MSNKSAQDSASWEFINKGSRYMLLDNLSKGLEPLLVLLCAKLYAGGEWGFFKYFDSVVLLLVRLAVVGLDRGVVWIYSRREGEGAFLRAFSRAVNFSVLAGTVLAALAGLQWLGYLPAFGRMELPSGARVGFDVACYLAAVPLQAGTVIFLQAFFNKRALLPVLLVRNLIVPVATLLPAALLAFTPWKPHGIAVPYLAGSLLGFILAAAFFVRIYRIGWRDWALGAWVPGDLLRFSLPMGSTDFLMSFAYRIDILLLGRYYGILAVEVYSVVVMIANTLKSVRQSFDGILLSVFSAKGEGGMTPGHARAFNYACWLVLTLQAPFLPLALLFGEELLGLISPAYAGGGGILSITLGFNLAITVTTFYSQLIIGLGSSWVVPFAQGTFFAASAGLNFLLIPRLGPNGAAIATGFAALAAGAVCMVSVAARTRSLVVRREFFAPLAAAWLWFVPVTAASIVLDPDLPWRILGFAASLGGYAWQSRRQWRRFNPPAASAAGTVSDSPGPAGTPPGGG